MEKVEGCVNMSQFVKGCDFDHKARATNNKPILLVPTVWYLATTVVKLSFEGFSEISFHIYIYTCIPVVQLSTSTTHKYKGLYKYTTTVDDKT